MMKTLLMIIFAALVFSGTAQAKTIGDVTEDMAIDKVAHFSAGLAVSRYLVDEVKLDKWMAVAVTVALAFIKEQTDTKSDPKDFIATAAGATIILINWKWEF